jgi:pyruvate/2-oxoglutarate/acetoin dehydrogenase E1 component
MVGLATGMALRGLRPWWRSWFGDFSLWQADQIVNTDKIPLDVKTSR